MPDIQTSGIKQDFNQLISNGERVYFRYFTGSIQAGSYDDLLTLYTSGNDIQTSGMIFSIDSKQGSRDSVLVEQGLLLNNDLKVYVLGHIQSSGIWRFGLGGSPPSRWYGQTDAGVQSIEINGNIAFKKFYGRYLVIGSLDGE